MLEAWLPLAILSTSLFTGVAIFCLGEERHTARTLLNLTGAVLKLGLVGIVLLGVARDHAYETRLPFLPGIDLVLRADALSLLFVSLSAALWLLTTIYAIGYLEGAPHRSRFFGFFSLCVAATMGIALAGNLPTFFLFYELLTISTYPLVVHRGTPEALRGGACYLRYALAGGALLLLGIAWLHGIAGPVEFRARGALDAVKNSHQTHLVAIFALLIAGLGVKAALIPFHRWLPVAMVAPAPVSALLHAVAVVKAGAFGIVRVVYDVYGVELADRLGVMSPLVALACATILWGSWRALGENNLKRRLAYSTVSQVSYITLGVATFGPVGTIGGLAHLVHQGLMKITLFFCAGNVAEAHGVHYVSELRGIGRRMPWTMAAFSVGALGMIGVPPVAGFISKWYLGLGAIEAHEFWVLGVLMLSSLLNAAYFLPILYAAWFAGPPAIEAEESGRRELSAMLLVPTVLAAILSLAAGLFAATPYSPLAWAELIAAREYGR